MKNGEYISGKYFTCSSFPINALGDFLKSFSFELEDLLVEYLVDEDLVLGHLSLPLA